MQTIWDDSCKYSDFCEVVRFARNAIKSGGTKNMKAASHKIEVEMPDYLGFEVIDN